jgi:2-C-methyl-D-erythritol 4-phosphate cytidylyltransferase
VPATATVKKVDTRRGTVISTEDRRSLYLAQTPQVFRKDLLFSRYRVLGRKALCATDEAALFDGSKVPVRVTEGDVKNIKVTTAGDGEFLRQSLKKRPGS